jgi:hypothetical protein
MSGFQPGPEEASCPMARLVPKTAAILPNPNPAIVSVSPACPAWLVNCVATWKRREARRVWRLVRFRAVRGGNCTARADGYHNLQLLRPKDVERLILCAVSALQRIWLQILYGTGVRREELVSLKISDIDSAHMVIHIQQGKGWRDRNVIVSSTLRAELRNYWRSLTCCAVENRLSIPKAPLRLCNLVPIEMCCEPRQCRVESRSRT